MTDWCILRCAGSRTLALAASLSEAGFDVWTPVDYEQTRDPVTRNRKKAPIPMTSCWVFASASQFDDLLSLSRSPSLTYLVWDSEKRRMVAKGHPVFRLHWDNGQYRMLTDRQLEPLRISEQRGRPKQVAHQYKVGDPVRLADNGHAGLVGSVVWTRGTKAKVEFPHNWVVEVETWMLFPAIDATPLVHVSKTSTEQARPRAQAA